MNLKNYMVLLWNLKKYPLRFKFFYKTKTLRRSPRGLKQKVLTLKMSSVSAIIAKLEKQLKALKVSTKIAKKNEKKPEKKSNKKGKISEVNKKEDLKKFTVVELKEFIKKNKIVTKKTDKLHKEDWINLIWNNIKNSIFFKFITNV